MGIRIAEGWGGNRVWDGSQWMELYYEMDAELTGDAPFSLTATGKFPNNIRSIYARLQVNVVFDANTLDSYNTFSLSGGSWPSFSGSVSIPTVSEKNLYNNKVLISTIFGSTYNLHAIASLSGIDRVPGTTSFDKWLSMPARAWATPDQPVSLSYTYNPGTSSAVLSWSGNQNSASADKYWQYVDTTIYRTAGWVETLGDVGTLTNKTFSSLSENRDYLVGVRSRNEDGGSSSWAGWIHVYTKPSAPTATQAVRNTADPTQVVVSFTINAAYPGEHHIERRMTPADSWVDIATVNSNVNSYTDTVTTGLTPEYRVRTRTPDNKTYSDYSNVVMSDAGSIKHMIPGMSELYLGTVKIAEVWYEEKQIWKS